MAIQKFYWFECGGKKRALRRLIGTFDFYCGKERGWCTGALVETTAKDSAIWDSFEKYGPATGEEEYEDLRQALSELKSAVFVLAETASDSFLQAIEKDLEGYEFVKKAAKDARGDESGKDFFITAKMGGQERILPNFFAFNAKGLNLWMLNTTPKPWGDIAGKRLSAIPMDRIGWAKLLSPRTIKLDGQKSTTRSRKVNPGGGGKVIVKTQNARGGLDGKWKTESAMEEASSEKDTSKLSPEERRREEKAKREIERQMSPTSRNIRELLNKILGKFIEAPEVHRKEQEERKEAEKEQEEAVKKEAEERRKVEQEIKKQERASEKEKN